MDVEQSCEKNLGKPGELCRREDFPRDPELTTERLNGNYTRASSQTRPPDVRRC